MHFKMINQQVTFVRSACLQKQIAYAFEKQAQIIQNFNYIVRSTEDESIKKTFLQLKTPLKNEIKSTYIRIELICPLF